FLFLDFLKIRIAEVLRNLPGRKQRCQVDPEQPTIEFGQLPQSYTGRLQCLLQECGLAGEGANDLDVIPPRDKVLRERPAPVGDEDGPHTVTAQLSEEISRPGAGGVSPLSVFAVEGGELVAPAPPGPASRRGLGNVGEVLVEDDAVGRQTVQRRRAD